ncbi:MAG: ADP-ribosylglycohydrolase family protein [Pyrinomonadaceae bacterium]
MSVSLESRVRGGILGLLIGDALGVPYEFHNRQSIPPPNEIEFEPPDWFRRSHAGVLPGTYSDDGAQALVLLHTLLECKRFDPAHFAGGLCAWKSEGFMAVGRSLFDIGIQTNDSIGKLEAGVEPLLAGGVDEFSNGNGSLMRVLPLAIWHKGSDEELVSDAFNQSALTHGHLRSKLCCGLYCLWARRVLQNRDDAWQDAVEIIYSLFTSDGPEHCELDSKIEPRDAIYDLTGSGYVVDTLKAAKWACYNASFEATVKAAISLGDDTDTTACVAGGIAGLNFGVEDIPLRWRNELRGGEIFMPLIDKLVDHVLN